MGVAILWLISLATVAQLHEGKCSECERWHVKSTVQMNLYGTATAMYCGPPVQEYDENGFRIPIQPSHCNTITTEGRCSRGHKVVLQEPY